MEMTTTTTTSSSSSSKQPFDDNTILEDLFRTIVVIAATDHDACLRLLLQYLISKPPRKINDEFDMYLKSLFAKLDEIIDNSNSALSSDYGSDDRVFPLYPNAVHLSNRAALSSLVPKAMIGEKKDRRLFRFRPSKIDDVPPQVVADILSSLPSTVNCLYCLLRLVRSAANQDASNTIQTILHYNCSIDRSGKQLLLYLKSIYEDVLPCLHSFNRSKINDLDSIARMILSCFDLVVDMSLEMNYSSRGASVEDEWMELIALLAGSGSSSDQARTGALVSDYFKLCEGKVVALIGSSDDYFLDALRVPSGYLRMPTFNDDKYNASAYKEASLPIPLPPPSISHMQREQEEAHQGDIDTLKSLFPAYKDIFLGACLAYFDWQVERAADALLTDNIPDHLRCVDTSVVRVSAGKGGGLSTNAGTLVSLAGLGDAQKYSGDILPMTSDYKRREKERLRLMEKQEEEDNALIEREYDDDYDDQYDNPTFLSPNPSTGIDNMELCDTSTNIPHTKSKKSKKEEQSASLKINWEVRIRETKRINALIRQEEDNIAYWRNMHVHNAPVDGAIGTVEDEKEKNNSSDSKPTAISTTKRVDGKARQTHTQGVQEGCDAGQGEKKKYRTKTFDKHHQKDKANRKFYT